jgi:hypothetical protein
MESMKAKRRATAALARRVCNATWTLFVTRWWRWRGRFGTKARPSLMRRLYVFGGVDRSTYESEISRVVRRLKPRRKPRQPR